jgi:hypothetical protein
LRTPFFLFTEQTALTLQRMRAAISAIVMSVPESSEMIRPISKSEKKRPFPRIEISSFDDVFVLLGIAGFSEIPLD